MLGARPFGKAPLGGTGQSPQADNSLVLQIGPLDATPLLVWPSLTERRELSGRNELECALLSTTGYIPELGDEVLLRHRGGLSFAGSVHEVDVGFLTTRSAQQTVSRIRCVDLNEIADRRRVFEVFEGVSVGEIVRFVVLKYLAAESIHIGDVQEGPMVTRMVASMTVRELLDELAEKSGFYWNIDNSRAMHCRARTAAPAPFTITSANAVFRTIRASRTRNQYRNVQFVDGGHGITDEIPEFFAGDGVRRTFTVEYPLYDTPTIAVNFQPQTVGIRGVDSGKQWYWNAGENSLGQDPSGAVLRKDVDTLQVLYRGRFNLFQIVEDTAAILERQSVEGGSGRYEHLVREDGLDGQDVVQEKGLSLLRRHGTLDSVAVFELDQPGLDCGQLVPIDVTRLRLNGAFLITQMEVKWFARSTPRFLVTATTGDLKARAQDFFTQFLGTRRSLSIREGEILQEVLSMRSPVGVSDSIEATLIDVTSDEWGTGEFGTAEMGP